MPNENEKEERQLIAKRLEASSIPRKRSGITERMFVVSLYHENSKFWPAMELLAEISKEFPVKPI